MSSSGHKTVLVAGIGNPDRGDDGVGPVVLARLRGRVPAGIYLLECVRDVLTLLDEWKDFSDVTVVDAAGPNGRPGRIHRFDLIAQPLPADFARGSTHAFGVADAAELGRSLGRLPRRLIAYLVEGEQFDLGAPLSPAVAEAVDAVAQHIVAEIARVSGFQQV
jgi:hydrogenase maturation protease